MLIKIIKFALEDFKNNNIERNIISNNIFLVLQK